MKVKKIKVQTGIHYPSLKPYYQIQELCTNCGKPIRIIEGEVDCYKKIKREVVEK